MRIILNFIGGFVGLVFLSALNIGISYILPYPFSKLNLIFAVLILIMILAGKGSIVWVSFFSHFIIELFAASPFGVILISSTISILFTYWLFKNLFTNRSWYATITVTGIALILYRFFYIIGLFFAKASGAVSFVPWQFIISTAFWELLFTLTFVALAYLIISQFSKKLKNKIIEAQRFSV
jgi:cell shape-determining protein MreD